MPYGKHRELTNDERAAVRKLVRDLCANYDRDYGCLLLDDNCYMFYGAAYTNSGMCRYFRSAVLPNDPVMEAMLTGSEAVETRECNQCGKTFPADGKKAYCSAICAGDAKKRQQRGYMRERRGDS